MSTNEKQEFTVSKVGLWYVYDDGSKAIVDLSGIDAEVLADLANPLQLHIAKAHLDAARSTLITAMHIASTRATTP